MDLTWSAQEEGFRSEVREWLADNVPRPSLPSGDTREGFALHVEWEKRLFSDRWSVVSWPEGYGGRGASLWQWLIFEEEYYRAGAPQRVTQNGIFLLAPALFEFGTGEQKEHLLPRMAAAEDLWCQGWSEPGAGSDLAAVSSRAERTSNGWALHGQKTWTTRGAFCTHLFGLFRTDPSAERHKGLSYFLVPLDTPGVTVRGFGRLDGDEGFAEVFFDGAEVGDGDVLGEVDRGWSVAMATTGSERGLTLRSPGRFEAVAQRLLALYRERATTGEANVLARREAVVRGWMEAEAYRLFTLQEVTGLADGRSAGAESSLSKLWWSDMDVRLHECALSLLAEPELDGTWMRGFEFSLAGPIYAGTNEIQRNIVAERLLGLPRGVGVRLGFDEEELALRNTVADLLAKEVAPGAEPVSMRPVWKQLAAVGVQGLAAPVDAGGSGAPLETVALVLAEAGAAALSLPLADTAAVGVPVLVAGADPGGHLAGLIDGSLALSFASGGLAPSASLADLFLLESGVLFTRQEVELEPAKSVDPMRDLARVHPKPGVTGLALDASSAELGDRAAVAAAAELVGLGRAMVVMAVEHVKERRQFGVPVGSFQAVKHRLADAHLQVEFAAPAVWAAAWHLERGTSEAGRAVSLAKALTSDAAWGAGRAALQCHGAIGYTVEYRLHFWLKRAWCLAGAHGSAQWHLDRIGRELGV